MILRVSSVAFLLLVALSVPARILQDRDHLTLQEQDLIKDAQILDERIAIFVKAADRRLLVINGVKDPATAKQLKKDQEKWGDLPTGSHSELIHDVAKILDEAITNIDDVSS